MTLVADKSKTEKPQRGLASEGRCSLSWTRVQLEECGIRDCEARRPVPRRTEEKTTMWKVSTSSRCAKAASGFLTESSLCLWALALTVRSYQAIHIWNLCCRLIKLTRTNDVKLHPSWPLVNIDRVVTVTSTRGGWGLHWIVELPVFYIYNHFIGKRLNVFNI